MTNKKGYTEIKGKKIKRTAAETIAIFDRFTVKLGYKTNAVELVKQARSGEL